MRRILDVCSRLFLVAAVAAAAAPAGAQEAERELGWDGKGELSWVQTGGNAESSSYGIKGAVGRTWEDAEWRLDVTGVRAEASDGTRVAVGTAEACGSPGRAGCVIEDAAIVPKAERYALTTQYDRRIAGDLFWYVGGGWERSRFAGIEHRLVGAVGGGRTWDRESSHVRAAAALTYTSQEESVDNPATPDEFAGVRLELDHVLAFGLDDRAEWSTGLVVDRGLGDSDELRSGFETSVSVLMTDRLALKAGAELQYDDEPALEAVPIVTPEGASVGTIDVPLEELDYLFTASLVVRWPSRSN